MRRLLFVLSILVFAVLFGVFSATPNSSAKPNAALATPVSVYGAWHCGNDFCTWASVRNMTDFNTRNRWIINRGDGTTVRKPDRLELCSSAAAAEQDERRRQLTRHTHRHEPGSG